MKSKILTAAFTVAAAALLLSPCALLDSCSTPSGQAASAALNAAFTSPAGQKTLADLGTLASQEVATALASAASKAAGTKGVSATSAAATTLWTNSNVVTASGDIAALLGTLPSVASAAKTAYTAATANGASPAQATNAIAAVVSTGAGAPPPIAAKSSSLHESMERVRAMCARPFVHFRNSAVALK